MMNGPRILIAENDVAYAQRLQQMLESLHYDGFGAENQRHGQSAGDKLLQSMAIRLRQQLRSYDTRCRTGADAGETRGPNTVRSLGESNLPTQTFEHWRGGWISGNYKSLTVAYPERC